MMAKNFWKSRTLWFNVLALVVIIASAFGYVDFVPDENTAQYGAVLITLINVVLRFVTREPLKV